jgi:hypothetical protein
VVVASDEGAVRHLVAAAAKELGDGLTERTAELEAIFLASIPELRGDDAIQELMVASTAANLSVMFDALRYGIAVDQIDVPAPAAAYAQRLAQRGLPLEALLRAYRLGDHRFIRWFLHTIAAHAERDEDLVAATSETVDFTVEYVDRISEALIAIYRAERKLWGQRTETARAAQIRAVLHDDALDESTAEIMTGHTMRHWHVGVVAWAEMDDPDAARNLDGAAQVLRRLGGAEALVVPGDDHTLWCWISSATPTAADLDAFTTSARSCPGVRFAFGEPARQLAGFRSTHREALRAQAVAEAASPGAPVTSYGRVQLAALLSENLPDLRSWVARTLGDLARDDEGMARLRETVLAFLETSGSFSEAAKRLHVHRNTVHYRLKRAEEVRGRPFSDDRIYVEVALVTCERLGTSVLTSP